MTNPIKICLAAFLSLAMPLATACQIVAPSVPVQPRHEANFDEERRMADELYLAGKILEALPLYEDLCRQDQTIAVFAERHGAGLLRKAGTLPQGPEHTSLQEQGMAEYRRAQKLGDNSDLVQTVLAAGSKSLVGSALTGIPLSVGYTYRGTVAAQQPEKAAEIAFNRQDEATALSLYQQAATLDPTWYEPALYAGDMEFRLRQTQAAGVWFSKAIAIDPDRETAYRYWGDALFKSGDFAGAKVNFELAVIAEPYGRTDWLALQQWARLTKTTISVPQIAIPAFTNKDGVLNVDPKLDTTQARAAGLDSWRRYQECRSRQIAANTKFSFAVSADGSTHPNGPYHTLADETGCLRATLVALRAKLESGAVTPESLDPGLRLLDAIDQAGMLQAWIMLNHSDQQDRFDYPPYRKAHRELLVQYLNRFVVPTATPAFQP